MEKINYEPGTGDRFVLRVFDRASGDEVRTYGGDAVSPLYEPQALQLRDEERGRGFRTEMERLRPDGTSEVEADN